MLFHRPGSVIADIQLTGDSSFGTPEYILSTLRIVIPYQSGLDKNTDKVESTNIVLREYNVIAETLRTMHNSMFTICVIYYSLCLLNMYIHVCVCVCVCVRSRAHVCACAFVNKNVKAHERIEKSI